MTILKIERGGEPMSDQKISFVTDQFPPKPCLEDRALQYLVRQETEAMCHQTKEKDELVAVAGHGIPK